MVASGAPFFPPANQSSVDSVNMDSTSSMRGTRSAGFSLIELLVVVSIIVILGVISLPQIQSAIQKGKAAQSMGSLRQIGAALGTYAIDNNGTYPLLCVDGAWNAPYWSQLVTPYLGPANNDPAFYVTLPPNRSVSQVLLSPLVPKGLHHSLGDYGANIEVIRVPGQSTSNGSSSAMTMGGMSAASRVVMVAEAQSIYNGLIRGSYYIDTSSYVSSGGNASSGINPSDRNTGKIYSLFCDGHVEGIKKQDFIDNRRQYLLINP